MLKKGKKPPAALPGAKLLKRLTNRFKNGSGNANFFW